MLPPNSRTGQVHVREPSLVMSLISLVECSDISAIGWAVAVTDAVFSSWSSAIETKKALGDLVSVYTTRGITTRKMQKERDTDAQPIIPSNREQSRNLIRSTCLPSLGKYWSICKLNIKHASSEPGATSLQVRSFPRLEWKTRLDGC